MIFSLIRQQEKVHKTGRFWLSHSTGPVTFHPKHMEQKVPLCTAPVI